MEILPTQMEDAADRGPAAPYFAASSTSRIQQLAHAFSPRCVAVVGASATRGKWSNDVFRLLDRPGTGRRLIPVNPQRDMVEGARAYPSVSSASERVDYALVVVPRDAVLAAVQDCVAAEVAVVHVLSSGFGEVPGPGRDLQDRLKAAVQGSRTALIGPNAMGVYSARSQLTFAAGCHFEPGFLSFVSQSGGLCYDVLIGGQARGLSFNKILSVGNCADLDWPDYVRYFAEDSSTHALALYIESVSDGRRLFEELRTATKAKPVFVLKGGKSRRGSQSVVSHTGRLAGEYDIWKAMLRQAGAHEVASLGELLLEMRAWSLGSDLSARQVHEPGAGTMVIGTGGGATVLVADACESAGVEFAPVDARTVRMLESMVPGAESLGGVGNPIEVGADRLLADPGLLARLTEVACADPSVDSILIHLNLIAVANNLADGLEGWDRACDRLANAEMRGKVVSLVLRNGDCGDATEELRRRAMHRLGRKRQIAVFGTLDEALALLRGIGASGQPGNGRSSA